MIQLTLMDGSSLEIPRADARELLPYRHVFVSAGLRGPVEGLFAYHGKLVPLLGPLPSPESLNGSVDQRPWILVLKGYAQVVRGLPEFATAAAEAPVELPRAA